MSTAHQALRDLERSGAATFDATRLAGDLSPVTRRVRRHRAVRAGAGSVAGLAVLGAGAYGVLRWGTDRTVAPAVTSPAPTPSTSGAHGPSPSPSVAAPELTAADLVIPGERVDDTIARLAAHYGASENSVREAMVLALPPEANGEPEGWVAPGDFPAPATAQEAAGMLVASQLQNLESMGVAREDWLRTVTLASILVKEAPDPYDQPAVSSVIWNRLDAGMMLELESPLIYITRADERTVSDDGFAVDSPYNTFMYEGLPPAPIGASDLGAIDSAAHPSAGSQLYFVRDPKSGAVLLAETFEEHRQNLIEVGLLDE
ncbi:endolytic transglycosylase MltG [Demequina phytophila]|uniref:endolytic transglycosylase MltG n=1 Tax=Demequina phytophila TaxID=1638981 RepID=UPI00078263FC|nr:endolytic transglycosylase MltG [Demequina phytophila]